MNTLKIALIPAYEPQHILVPLVRQLKENDFIVVVVDDGSGADYRGVFEELDKTAVVLMHDENRGKGAALKTGLTYIKTCFGKRCVVVTVDADGQHTVSDARKVCEEAAQHPGELVLGSRGFDRDVPMKSQFGNTVTRFVYRLFTGVAVHDTQTGLRAFTGELLDELIAMEGERYEYEMNMLLMCAKRGIPMREVTIETIYRDENAGSHFRAVTDSVLIYREIIKFSAASFLSFLIDYFLYLTLLAVTGALGLAYGLVIANVGARLVSGTFNYTVNRRVVFGSDASPAGSAVRYLILAVSILAFNTSCLQFLVGLVGVPAFAAKLIVETVLFLVSYVAQKKIVFAATGKEAFA